MRNRNWIGLVFLGSLSIVLASGCSDDDDNHDGTGGTSSGGSGSGGSASGGAGSGGAGSGGTGSGGMTGTGAMGGMTGTGAMGGMTGTGATGSTNDSQECTDYCTAWFAKSCNSEPKVTDTFADQADCLDACTSIAADGTDGDQSGDTIQCRIKHLSFATPSSPHCWHAQETATAPCN